MNSDTVSAGGTARRYRLCRASTHETIDRFESLEAAVDYCSRRNLAQVVVRGPDCMIVWPPQHD
jgi:hypothetical protein